MIEVDNDSIHRSLLDAGYRPRTMVSDMVHDAITRAFELLGESCAGLLINHLSAMHRLPRHIVLTRYDLISRAISQTFGYGSEVFMHEIRANLLRSLPHLDNSLTTAEIIHLTHKIEALRFVRNLRDGYAVFVHSSYKSKQEILGSFFQPVNAGRLVNTTTTTTASAGGFGSIIKYDGDGNITAGGRTYCNLTSCKHQYHYYPPPSSSKDHAAQGRHVRRRAGGVNGRNRSFLCSYSMDEASRDFANVVLAHDHVITDQPYIVYSKIGYACTPRTRQQP
ncbi:hypothetical protein [Nitrososphaera viennensis]|uniref:Uncharacterized protein n=2 Tax=Nitrososphaera viennensis TaxID=1034015 RepID=A0A060HEK4_9ARCH|nr:hypothetical protein [Nitrososphaera viennensis]AIC15099.1 hypothetical protein NVIE_008760 [Nitrososphaera viennensis EN76]UVS70023.1 hypothetical protein NWT39_04360 [Nitrososphaera viennensis]